MQPALQFTVVVQLGEFALDQCAFALIHVPVGLGRRDQCLKNGLAVLLDLSRWQAVDGLRFALRRAGLLRLPIAISFVGNHAQCRQATVGQGLATKFTRLLIPHQQPHRTGCQGSATRTAEQTAQPTTAEQTAEGTFVVRLALAAGLVLQHVLA